MDEIIEKSVERVIRAMHENLGEQITIDDMARTAMFSKFHFSRIFQRVTGISPGRFLSALRLQEAKRLLLTTSMTVADISHLVGYNSIGTFSSRFRGSVGVSPTEYRQQRGYVTPLAAVPDAPPVAGPSSVHGQVWQPRASEPGPVVVGLFPDRIAHGTPVRHATRMGPGPFMLADVPDGTWYLLAHSAELGDAVPDPDQTYVAAFGPLEVGPRTAGRRPHNVDLWLRPRRIFDPPALLAQLDQPMWTAQAWASGRADQAALPGA
ncbi:helix-turn-helix domain-containing protein [Actinophytocola sp.]|uniref:helix-turn-helix domain-containing protein n=1 Tax=Actinophytocola sp. TaxID=1872138 RepID=UPI003D6A331D